MGESAMAGAPHLRFDCQCHTVSVAIVQYMEERLEIELLFFNNRCNSK